MPKLKKFKIDSDGGFEKPRRHPPVTCILNVIGIQHGDFTTLSNAKGSAADKQAHLHSICDRRLLEPHDSPNRMEEDVCNRISNSLADADLQAIGFHRGCYQNFTKNQDRLKCNVETSNEASTSCSHRKPRLSIAIQLFPPEGIFWQRSELKVSGKTERCHKLPVFKES